MRTLKPFGRIITLGYASGTIPQIPANLLLVKNIAVLGHNMGLYYGWGPRDERLIHEAKIRTMIDVLFQLTVDGVLKPHVSHRFALDDFRLAMKAIMGREAQGKVIIRFGEQT